MEVQAVTVIHSMLAYFGITALVAGLLLDGIACLFMWGAYRRFAGVALRSALVALGASALSGWLVHGRLTNDSAGSPGAGLSEATLHMYSEWSLFALFAGLLFWRGRLDIRRSSRYLVTAWTGILVLGVQRYVGMP